jgi:hypothetical protein
MLALQLALRGAPDPSEMNALADRYVRLVLAVGQHDASFVDAYYGPPEWKTAAAAAGKLALPALLAEATTVQVGVTALAAPADEMGRLRREYLLKQVAAVGARIRMLQGTRMSFDEESKALYDAVAPTFPTSHFDRALKELEALVPGTGPLATRVEAFRQRYAIPPAKLETVFRAAIAECRDRTAAHIALPDSEQFRLQFVTNQVWSGYNWYQGTFQSLIQVNTDLPIYIDRAVDLACHEGYPGHHVYNVLLEKSLVRDRGWVEMTVYPLFSPQSLIAEGSANYGIDVAFPGDERIRFEREVLFPAAGLDGRQAADYYEIQAIVDRLSYAGNEAARRYLNREMPRAAAAEWLTRFALMSAPRAEQRTRFMDDYRSYVINYNLGKDLVKAYVEGHGGVASQPAKRWDVFADLLRSPRLPSGLK